MIERANSFAKAMRRRATRSHEGGESPEPAVSGASHRSPSTTPTPNDDALLNGTGQSPTTIRRNLAPPNLASYRASNSPRGTRASGVGRSESENPHKRTLGHDTTLRKSTSSSSTTQDEAAAAAQSALLNVDRKPSRDLWSTRSSHSSHVHPPTESWDKWRADVLNWVADARNSPTAAAPSSPLQSATMNKEAPLQAVTVPVPPPQPQVVSKTSPSPLNRRSLHEHHEHDVRPAQPILVPKPVYPRGSSASDMLYTERVSEEAEHPETSRYSPDRDLTTLTGSMKELYSLIISRSPSTARDEPTAARDERTSVIAFDAIAESSDVPDPRRLSGIDSGHATMGSLTATDEDIGPLKRGIPRVRSVRRSKGVVLKACTVILLISHVMGLRTLLAGDRNYAITLYNH